MKITLQEALRRVDKTKPEEAEVNAFCRALGIDCLYWNEEFNRRVKLYFIDSWICTDTWVGTGIVYFYDEPIAIQSRDARKSSFELTFFNRNGAERLRRFMIELQESEIVYVGMDHEIHLREAHSLLLSP